MKTFVLAFALAISIPAMAIASEPQDQRHNAPPEFEHGHRGDHEGPGREQGREGHGGHDRERGHGNREQDIGLTQDQQHEAHQLFRDGNQERSEIIKKHIEKLPKGEREAMQEELRISAQKHREDFLKLLTPEQKLKAEALQKAHAEKTNDNNLKYIK